MKETAKIHKIEYPVAADDDGATIQSFQSRQLPRLLSDRPQRQFALGDIVNSDIEKAIQLALKAEPAGK